ncbi:MAG: hypothetical protein Tsb009_23700 [Planctomycetaceae bacterium]
MKKLFRMLKSDESGMILSAELVLVITIGVLGMIVGINSVASSINGEMNDISSAFGAIDQSYSYQGMTKVGHATVVGSGYWDRRDYCDCSVIVPTVGSFKSHGSYVPATPMPAPAVPAPTPVEPCDNCPTPHVAPCDNCPPHLHDGKLLPIPDPHHHMKHGKPHLKQGKPHRKHPGKLRGDKSPKKIKGPKLNQ